MAPFPLSFLTSFFLSPRFPFHDFSTPSFVHPYSHLPSLLSRNALERGRERVQRSKRRLTGWKVSRHPQLSLSLHWRSRGGARSERGEIEDNLIPPSLLVQLVSIPRNLGFASPLYRVILLDWNFIKPFSSSRLPPSRPTGEGLKGSRCRIRLNSIQVIAQRFYFDHYFLSSSRSLFFHIEINIFRERSIIKGGLQRWFESLSRATKVPIISRHFFPINPPRR